ncbi:hypothetical protein CL619_00145 [archaeon]|nr:hypothetical protein [archaeon]|tara:strand:+ start:392 stop:1063 length:672 start_codon:yes stop_codon:yes gene_type:complete
MPKKRRRRKAVPQKRSRSVKKKQTRFHKFKHSLVTALIFALVALGIWVILLMLEHFIGFDLFNWFQKLPFIYPIAVYVTSQIKQKTFEGIIYSFSFSSLFFIPTPLELLFLGFLSTARTEAAVIIPTFIGLLIGQHANFLGGRVFGRIIKRYVNHSTRKKVKERLHEHGAAAIFFINLLPLPYPITNFLAGSLKYPYKKWLLFVSLGLSIKLVFIAWLFAVVF